MERGLGAGGGHAVTDYEPRVQDTVNSLLRALDERAGTSVDISEWVGFFAFDTMGRVAYSQDFGMLDRGEGTVEVDGRSTSISALHETTKVFGILGPVPWLIKMIIQTNLAGELAAFQQWCHSTMKYKQETFNPAASSPTDMSSHLLAFHHSAQDPTKRQTQRAIQNESILFIIAGSDTTASAITNAIFYLTRDRTRYLKLRAVLDALPDSTARSLASVRYLDHVINETLRLKPPACEGLTRETPEGGITIPASPASGTTGDVFIPGSTVVSVPTWSLHRDVRFWGADADAFRPERFEGVDLNAEITPFIPFTRGAHTCPGKALGVCVQAKAHSPVSDNHSAFRLSTQRQG
ncbi:putative cytochrome p450 protein [Neofusicoccum parvum UCRNP2]|uniref:Putative cytochrome p450 protein n=1 Tax=Botryosphaeria parva (strain UCR-NP2) TaxID=1287680 RepID=R1FYL5_BOTPV|nr:putative cytochrome p450 protein [Neofusicoccum parvum UCRNP2]